MKILLLYVALAPVLVRPAMALSNTWVAKRDFSGGPREGAVAFNIGNVGYLGTGYTSYKTFTKKAVHHKDIWAYDRIANTWTQKADLPGEARAKAVAFAIGTKGYIATGQAAGLTFADLWEYNATTNAWVQRGGTFPGGKRHGAVAFTLGTKGYIATGFGSGNATSTIVKHLNDLWEYDPLTDKWTRKADLPGPARLGAVAFSVVFVGGTNGYVTTGMSPTVPLNDTYAFDPATNKWTSKAPLPGPARFGATAVSIDNHGYLFCGQTPGADAGPLADVWRYDPIPNSWSAKPPFPGQARSMAATLMLGGRVYMCGGNSVTGDKSLADLWEYTP